MSTTSLPKSSLSKEDASTPWPSPSNPNKGRSFLRFLSLSQQTSGVVFSSFLLVHLLPPAIVAITGDEAKGSGFMLLSRVAYQNRLLEPALIYLPLTLHLTSSLLRRQLYPRSLPPKLTSHSLTGYLLVPLLTLHLLVHRILPSSSNPPISSLSPAELDLSYVGYAVQKWPWISSVAYGGLVALGVWHWVGGWSVVARRLGRGPNVSTTEVVRLEQEDEEEQVLLKPRKTSKSTRWWSWRATSTLLASTMVGVALVRLSRDAFVNKAMAARIEFVHRKVFSVLYR